MIWKKLTICLSLCLSFFCSLFASSSVSALSDLTYTSSTNQSTLCGGSDCYELGYRYVLLVKTGDTMSGSYQTFATFVFRSGQNTWSQQVQSFSNFILFSLPSDIQLRSFNITGSNISVTFSEFPPSSLAPSPTGTLNITENGIYDVSSYATAEVNVENEVIYGDYHNDLMAINNSILICGAICLVIYFFYCIYRMIIRSVT